jgi:hypothetical protein
MTFGTLQHGHTRQRGPEQACTHASVVRHAFRPAGSRRQHGRGHSCVCLGILDRFVGSTKIREKDLVQMGPLKVAWHAMVATSTVPSCRGIIANAIVRARMHIVITKRHEPDFNLMLAAGQPNGVRHMGLGQPISMGCASWTSGSYLHHVHVWVNGCKSRACTCYRYRV